MRSIVEKLEENAIPRKEAENLVESARHRIENGESPVDVLCEYNGPMSSEELLKLLPDE